MRRRLEVVRTGPERPPFVLRWIWYFAPLLVTTAMVGMYFAAKSAPREAPPTAASLEAYAELHGQVYRVADGARLRRGQALRFVVAPAHARFVTLSTSAGQVARVGPLEPGETRVELPDPIPVTAAGHLRVTAVFDQERVVSLAFDVE
jgi:hypothetical protein